MDVMPGGIDRETARADGVALRVAVRRRNLRHERRGGRIVALGADRRAVGKEGLLVIGKALKPANFKNSARKGRCATPGGRGCRANVEIPYIGKTAGKFKRAIAGTAVQTVVNRSHRKFVDDCERAAAHAHDAVHVRIRTSSDSYRTAIASGGLKEAAPHFKYGPIAMVNADEVADIAFVADGLDRTTVHDYLRLLPLIVNAEVASQDTAVGIGREVDGKAVCNSYGRPLRPEIVLHRRTPGSIRQRDFLTVVTTQ